MTTLSNKIRVSLPVAALASLLLGVAGAVTTVYSLKEQVLTAAREARRRDLAYYETREELGRTRERDWLDQKLDEIQVEVRALGYGGVTDAAVVLVLCALALAGDWVFHRVTPSPCPGLLPSC